MAQRRTSIRALFAKVFRWIELRFLAVCRALQRMKTECVVVGRNAWDWQFVDGLTGSSIPAGSVVEWKQLLVGDRPTRVDQSRSWMKSIGSNLKQIPPQRLEVPPSWRETAMFMSS